MRTAFDGRLPAFTDFVTYWIEKARQLVEDGAASRAGLVATNSVSGGSNLPALKRLVATTDLFCAWSDEPWAVDGAAVRVALVCFGRRDMVEKRTLDGADVTSVNADLTGGSTDLTKATKLTENAGACYEGGQKHGRFDVPGQVARSWLLAPMNPNGRGNADVIMPLLNAADLVRRSSDTWVVNFGERAEGESALYELPFEHVVENVKSERLASSLASHRQFWWRHHRSRPEIRSHLRRLQRYIVTPVVSKHRVFAWMHRSVWPSNLLDAVLRDDDVTFGLLHGRAHELWALRLGTWLGVGNDPRYTPSTTFETFPFPEGLTPNIPAAAYVGDPRATRIASLDFHGEGLA